MKKLMVAVSGAAMALAGLSAAPATAARHYTNKVECARWHRGRCVSWHRMTRRQARRAAAYRVGYRFGPNYGYTAYNALPSTYVRRYGLRSRDRYVYSNGYIYVVNPRTWAVIRVLQAF